MKRFLLLLLTLLCFQSACTQALQVQEPGYQLTDLQNSFAQDRINSQIAEATAPEAIFACYRLMPGTQHELIFSDHRLHQAGEPRVLSLVVQVKTNLKIERFTLMFDLLTGEKILPDALFLDKITAQDFMDEWVQTHLERDEYTYLHVDGLLPVPLENFYLTEYSIAVDYPFDSYHLFTQEAGGYRYYFPELKDILNLTENSLLSSLDEVQAGLGLLDNADRLAALLSEGRLPGVPEVMGMKVDDLIEQYGELTDSELFLYRERYVLAKPQFRDIHVVVGQEDDLIQGIYARRMNLNGIMVGESGEEEIVKVFGEHSGKLPLDEQMAQLYAMQPGSILSYSFGDCQLMLNLDVEGILRTVYLSKN